MCVTCDSATRPTAIRTEPAAMTARPPRASIMRPTVVDTALEASSAIVRPPNTAVWLQPVSAAIGLPSTPSA